MGSTPDFRYPVSASSMIDSHSDQYSSSLVLRRPQKGRAAALRDEPSKVRLLTGLGKFYQIIYVHIVLRFKHMMI